MEGSEKTSKTISEDDLWLFLHTRLHNLSTAIKSWQRFNSVQCLEVFITCKICMKKDISKALPLTILLIKTARTLLHFFLKNINYGTTLKINVKIKISQIFLSHLHFAKDSSSAGVNNFLNSLTVILSLDTCSEVEQDCFQKNRLFLWLQIF